MIKDRIIELCKMSELELYIYMETMLSAYYGKKVKKNKYEDYLYVQGKDPVCLIAHMDTVYSSPSSQYCYDQEQKILWSPTGLGADDRAGVLAIILLLERGYHPSIILTTGEEVGGAGAHVMTDDFKKCPIRNINYLIELDRAHSNDCVFYSCDNKKFKKYIASFGFEESVGTFTDISVFMETWGIAGVNLSIGYNNEHTYGEYINIEDFENTVSKVENMIRESYNCMFFKYVKEKIYFSFNNHICSGCNKIFRAGDKKFYYRDKTTKQSYVYCQECADWIEKNMV